VTPVTIRRAYIFGRNRPRADPVPFEVKQTLVRAAGFAALLGCWVVAALIPVRGCFDNGTCVTMSLLRSKAGFSEYWTWDYRWGWRIIAVVIGVAAMRTAFAVTTRSNASGSREPSHYSGTCT
jgi:hypothetical protein